MRNSRTSVKFAVVICIGLAGLAVSSIGAGLFGTFSRDCLIGSGKLTSDTREVRPFSAIETSGSFDVYVSCGEQQTLVVTIDDNLQDIVLTEVNGGVLSISGEGSFASHSKSRIDITVPELTYLSLQGSGDIIINDASTKELEVRVIGSGDVKLVNLKTDKLMAILGGSGSCTARGVSEQVDVRLSGSGDANIKGVKASEANVKVAGSGDVSIHATDRFTGRVSGSGGISVYGNPVHVSKRVIGSGDIRGAG